MNSASEPVLELLDECNIWLTRSSIIFNLEQMGGDPPSKSTVYRAIDPLVKHGLLEENDPSGERFSIHYSITDLGREFLEGELDARDLQETDI